MRIYVVPSERPDGANTRASIVGPRNQEIYNITESQAIDLALQILSHHGRYTVTDAMTGEVALPRSISTRPPVRRRSSAPRPGSDTVIEFVTEPVAGVDCAPYNTEMRASLQTVAEEIAALRGVRLPTLADLGWQAE